MIEILNQRPLAPIRAVLFDFDGTISTLRQGWEAVMAPLMIETLMGCGKESREALENLVAEYIDASTGIQTIFQMKWLAAEVEKRGGKALDPWDYKAEYNRRLMLDIEKKKARLAACKDAPEQYLMAGAVDFLQALRANKVSLYVASGTDHPDVVSEARALGVDHLFDEIAGAPVREESCSKEAVLRQLMAGRGLRGGELAVIGDGKVEIALGREAGALTIGLASDEKKRRGLNPVKRARLMAAGADWITGDFLETNRLLALMGLRERKE